MDSFGVILDGCTNISDSRIQNRDSLTWSVHTLEIQSTDRSFAVILGDGSVLTWGGATVGGDSRAVQGQLKNVQHIQASSSALLPFAGMDPL